MTNGDKIRSMTDEELREKVWINMENCEEMAKLTRAWGKRHGPRHGCL